jgi:hypothetical protein
MDRRHLADSPLARSTRDDAACGRARSSAFVPSIKWGDDDVRANNFWFVLSEGKNYRVSVICLGSVTGVWDVGRFMFDKSSGRVLEVDLTGPHEGTAKLISTGDKK